jgi:excisionase family DNA binding protein
VSTADGSENLTAEEGARQLGMSPAYIYRHKKALPFVVRQGRRVLVNKAALAEYNRRQAGKGCP